MSHWDSATQQIVRWPTRESRDFPGWVEVDCGCCAGIQWGAGDQGPRGCDRCNESGVIHLHVASLRTAEWPGGPLTGRVSRDDALWMLGGWPNAIVAATLGAPA